ncbi:GNAT family N-acetyltransferase [Lacisediminihabitans sp.]|uniref:GNAT family N-acetyltransferase n=1 Tax=Lacisediminihabitans sp. TaxID=2787631 RepID=UPI00374D0BD9
MTVIRVERADRVPWPDVEAALGHGGNGSTCWCQWAVNPDYSTMSRDEKHDALRDELAAGQVASPLVAYVDGAAAGWCRIAPRTEQPRLAHLSVVRRGSVEPMDDGTVWAVTCFVVRREYRGRGLAHTLLEHAVSLARDNGARMIEGYPIDLAERPGRPPNTLYIGTVGLFAAAGFEVTARPTHGRAVMTLRVNE